MIFILTYFEWRDTENQQYSETAKTVFSHLKIAVVFGHGRLIDPSRNAAWGFSFGKQTHYTDFTSCTVVGLATSGIASPADVVLLVRHAVLPKERPLKWAGKNVDQSQHTSKSGKGTLDLEKFRARFQTRSERSHER